MAFKDVVTRLKQARPYRAWKRYSDANGNLLAAGVGYFAFFSVFPALALAFTVFGFVLQGRPELLDTIADSLNETLPGMVKTANNANGIIGLSAPHTSTLTITGLVGFATLLLSGLGWVDALRTGIRGVFGLPAAAGNPVKTKLRDIGVLLTVGLGVAVSAVLTSAVGGVAEHVARWVGLGEHQGIVTATGLLVGVVFDTFLMVVLLRLLSGVHLPWPAVRQSAFLGAALLTAMKFFGGFLIGRATSNPLLGAVAVAVGLLFWLNLMSRVVLLSAAWAANDRDVAAPARRSIPEHPPQVGPPAATVNPLPYAAGLAEASTPSRERDRVSIAAGAVLGAVAAVALGALRRRR